MAVIIKLGEEIDVGPDSFVRRVKNVRAVFVNVDAGFRIIVRIAVAADMIAFLNHQHFFAGLFNFVSKNRSEKARTHDNEIIHFQKDTFVHLENRQRYGPSAEVYGE